MQRFCFDIRTEPWYYVLCHTKTLKSKERHNARVMRNYVMSVGVPTGSVKRNGTASFVPRKKFRAQIVESNIHTT